LFLEQYPSETSEEYPHAKEEITRAHLSKLTVNKTLTWREAFLVAYCDVWQPKTLFDLVYTQTQKQSFQKSPLCPEFLEMIVFHDKTSVFV